MSGVLKSDKFGRILSLSEWPQQYTLIPPLRHIKRRSLLLYSRSCFLASSRWRTRRSFAMETSLTARSAPPGDPLPPHPLPPVLPRHSFRHLLFFRFPILLPQVVAAKIRKEIADGVEQLKVTHGRPPGLAVLIVGERKDSQTYVRMKHQACEEVGIRSFQSVLPESVTQAEMLAEVSRFNEDPAVDGILVQLPLPPHLHEEDILAAISVTKDVDGFHPLNIGRLAMKDRDPLFVPCTPQGCMALLVRLEFIHKCIAVGGGGGAWVCVTGLRGVGVRDWVTGRGCA